MSERQLTPVFDGAKDLPMRNGWYASDVKPIFGDRSQPIHVWPRRYWNGKYFSQPVRLHESDQRTKYLQKTPTFYSNSDLYWCGLAAPHES